MNIPFLKMQGTKNDFIIFDCRLAQKRAPSPFDLAGNGAYNPHELWRDRKILSKEECRRLAARTTGIGCDLIVFLQDPLAPEADCFMTLINSDGSEPYACGNATRCVGRILFSEMNTKSVTIQTKAGLLKTWDTHDGMVTVDFGLPLLEWEQIPLSQPCDTNFAPITADPLSTPSCVNMGNPHAIFFVPDVDQVPLTRVGPILETAALFPEHCNISIAQIKSRQHIRSRIWERGCGITAACGSASSAVMVAAVRRNLTDRKVHITVDGGEHIMEWRESDSHVYLTGDAKFVFAGVTAPGFIEA